MGSLPLPSWPVSESPSQSTPGLLSLCPPSTWQPGGAQWEGSRSWGCVSTCCPPTNLLLKCCLFQEACRSSHNAALCGSPWCLPPWPPSVYRLQCGRPTIVPLPPRRGLPMLPSSASPGPTCPVSPGQVGSYKGQQGLHSQPCPVTRAGPGARATQRRTGGRDGAGHSGSPGVHGHRLLPGTSSTQSPSPGRTLPSHRE